MDMSLKLDSLMSHCRQMLAEMEQMKSEHMPATSTEDIYEESICLSDAGETIPLVESSPRQTDGTVLIKLIAPGWGSSGYYSESVLKRDGPTIFNKHTKMYVNHPTEAEERARPEGDVHNVAAVLAEDAKWLDDGPRGKGLYATAKVFSDHSSLVSEKGPFIGVSIRAAGSYREGEAVGRKGRIIERITKRQSIDFVTEPGAGGAVILSESASNHDSRTNNSGVKSMSLSVNTEVSTAAQQDSLTEVLKVKVEGLQKKTEILESDLRESRARETELLVNTKKLQEQLALRDAQDFVRGVAESMSVPAFLLERQIQTLPRDLKMKNGELDQEAFKPLVESRIREDMAFFAKASGSGQVRGVGGTQELSIAESQKRLESELLRMGVDGGIASRAATGRN